MIDSGKPPVFLSGGTRIVYEDRDLVIVDKPTGILTASVPGDDLDSVFRAIKVHVRHQAKRRGTQVWIIHRLDKEASGLLVFAKTQLAFDSLKEQFRSKRVHRVYSTVVEGVVRAPKDAGGDEGGTIQSFLIEEPDGMVRSVPPGWGTASRGSNDTTDAEPKLAITHYKVASTGQGRSMLFVKLETGRKNQIRVHMQEFRHSIVGDRRYGSNEDPVNRVCLHATELALAQPTTGATIRFSSPPPAAFFRLVGVRPAAGATHETAEWNGNAPPTNFDLQPIPANAAIPRVALPAPAAEAAPALRPGAKSVARAEIRPDIRPEIKPDKRPDKSPDSKRSPVALAGSPQGSSWDHVADWYSELMEDSRSDHHGNIIIPGAARLLDLARGESVLDVACGQGNLCRNLATLGILSTGVDASPRLIAAATRAGIGEAAPNFLVGDARSLDALKLPTFNAVSCVMALMNMDPLLPIFAGIASLLKPGGKFVTVVLHPAFRTPGQTSWGWDTGDEAKRDGPPPLAQSRTSQRTARLGGRGEHSASESNSREGQRGYSSRPGPRSAPVQYRRIDGYLSHGERQITMNPGEVAAGKAPVTTLTFHRPLQTYVRLLAQAGFVIDALEEWPSGRTSQAGPAAAEENRARKEIPMFLAIRALRRG